MFLPGLWPLLPPSRGRPFILAEENQPAGRQPRHAGQLFRHGGKTRRRDAAGAFNFERRLTADLNSSYSPAVACHDAMRNEVTIAARFRVVAAETGGVAAPAPETTHAPSG